MVFCLYLPPAESIRGGDAIESFAYVLSELYFYAKCKITFVCGDVNVRLGNMNDTMPDIDGISPRFFVDTVKISHGECFMDFLTDSKLCVLNGRVTPTLDDYTFISHLGKYVVDYIAVSHEALQFCTKSEVVTMTECRDKFNLYQYLSNSCKNQTTLL